MEMIPLTKDGHEALKKELEHLKSIERPNIIAAIAEARGHGDLRENAEYHAARERQAFIEGRIAELDDKLSRSEVVAFNGNKPSNIRFGAWVTLEDDKGKTKTYRLVGELEADIKMNKISISSPLGKALLGKEESDYVEIAAPGGVKEYQVVSIEY